MPRLQATGIAKRYGERDVLRGVDLVAEPGRLVLLMGRSGSGKSTLIRILAGLEPPSAGSVVFDGRDLARLSENQRDAFRVLKVGVVFQDFRLLPDLTVAENVRLPLLLAKRHDPRGTVARWRDRSRREERVRALLADVGLGGHADAFPETLSGGEQQRVAIARALANDPPLLLADEPTANLDEENAHAVMRLLSQAARSGRIVVVAAHDPIAVEYATVRYGIEGGRIGSRGAGAVAVGPAAETR